MLYYGKHYGWDENARDEFKDHPCFNSCAEFCERWDQSSFDPDYPMKTLDYFEPMVREVFGRKAYDPEVVREGFVSELTSTAHS
jgi:predicted HD phosphohydrolase